MGPASTSPPQYSCPACGAGLTDEDIMDGLAVKRGQEVYCHKYFRKQFPGECINHPGTRASEQCSVCGELFCKNCVIELQEKVVCRQCKGEVLAELRSGPRKPVRTQSPVAVLVAGILGLFPFFFCFNLFGLLAITGYLRHRREIARGLVRRSVLASIGFVLGIASVALFFIILVVILGGC